MRHNAITILISLFDICHPNMFTLFINPKREMSNFPKIATTAQRYVNWGCESRKLNTIQ